MRPVFRRLLAYCLLSFALALAAPGAYAHALGHLGDGHHQHHDSGCADGDSHDASGHACELCAAFSAAGAVGAPPSACLAGSATAGRAARAIGRAAPCEALGRFASRAPPRAR